MEEVYALGVLLVPKLLLKTQKNGISIANVISAFLTAAHEDTRQKLIEYVFGTEMNLCQAVTRPIVKIKDEYLCTTHIQAMSPIIYSFNFWDDFCSSELPQQRLSFVFSSISYITFK